MNVREELEIIRRQNGGLLRPRDVVAYAEDSETALHSRFQWDDSKAALEYRLWQAREIIRVEVTVVGASDEPIHTYVSLRGDRDRPGGGYRHTVDVMLRSETRKQLLAEAESDMRAFERKYHALQELAEAITSMRKVRNELKKQLAA